MTNPNLSLKMNVQFSNWIAMYVKLPIIMKYPVTVAPKESIKPAIDAFLNLLISSSKDSFKADDEFGFSLEDYRFEIYDPEVGLFHDTQMKRKQDIIGSIEDPTRKHKMSGSSINTVTGQSMNAGWHNKRR